MENRNTTFVKTGGLHQSETGKLIADIYCALKEKGYNPINQMVGYIMSGDPTYITNHKNARALITNVERDELVEELVRQYIETLSKTENSSSDI